jgi:hypothetical protein
MILYGTDMPWMIWPVFNRGLEDHPLVITFALALRLDAIAASRAFFSTLDATFPTCEATSLGPFSHLCIGRGPRNVARWGYIASTIHWRGDVRICHDSKQRRVVSSLDSNRDDEVICKGRGSRV